MLGRLRDSLTYANVMATVAVFLALGGGAYAALKLPKNSVGNTQLRRNAVTSLKVKNRSLLGSDFKLGQLPAGPRGAPGPPGAGPAGGALTGSYPSPTLACPSGTALQSGFCFETGARTAATWLAAAGACAGAGRRLATPAELYAVVQRTDVAVASPGEWTSTLYTDSGTDYATQVFEIAAGVRTGRTAATSTSAYRCVVNAGSQ